MLNEKAIQGCKAEFALLDEKKQFQLLRELRLRLCLVPYKSIDEYFTFSGAEHFTLDSDLQGLQIEHDSYKWNGKTWKCLEV